MSMDWCAVLFQKGTDPWQQFLAANGTFQTTAPEGAGTIAPTFAYVITTSGAAAFIAETKVAPAERPSFLGSYKLFTTKQTFSDTTATEIVADEDTYLVIDDYAFQNNLNIRKVDIKYGSIGILAFSSCPNLTSVHLGGAFVYFYAFRQCTALTDLQMEGGKLGTEAFRDCTGLTTVTITGSVGASVFSGCTDLTTVTINGSVGSSAFSGCSSLKTLDVAGSVGDSACANLVNLETLNLRSGVEIIGCEAFRGCTGLTGDLKLPESVTTIGSMAFQGCSGFNGSLAIPGSVTTIGSQAFRWCSGFNGNLTIAEGVTSIANNAFYGCSGFTGNLAIPGSVETIGGYAFYGCSGFTGNLTIPGSVETIGEAAFKGCTGFDGTLTLSEGVKELQGGIYSSSWHTYPYFVASNNPNLQDSGTDTGTFVNCTGFKKIVFASTIETCCQAFRGCTAVKEIVIPAGTKVIGGFRGCTGLVEVEIPDSVETIDQLAFSDCTQLVNVNLPKNLKRIEQGAFRNCYKLLKLTWPAGCEVGDYAFQNCINWKGTFVIPDGVTAISNGVFFGCHSLVSIEIPSSVQAIGAEAFCACGSLTSIHLPDGLTVLSEGLLRGCTSLTSVTIPSTVKTIGSAVFGNMGHGIGSNWCDHLGPTIRTLIIPEGVEEIKGCLFEWNPNVNPTVYFPGSIKSASANVLNNVGNVVFSADLPVGYELWSGVTGHNISITRASGGTGLTVWPVTQFMGYVQDAKPEVTILSSKIRDNDPEVLDVVYKVTSSKSTVKVRALAFEDGVRSFANVVRPSDFIADVNGNETKGNVGDGVTANEEHTLSWKVSSDWSTRLAKVTFEVLAVEDDILPLELMTIPATKDHPETWQVSWNYVTSDKSFEALLWLYADKDLGLTLQNGVLKNGDTRLVEGTTVSAYDALVYIYGKMGFKLLDGDNLAYVCEATRLSLPDKSSRQYAYRVVTTPTTTATTNTTTAE